MIKQSDSLEYLKSCCDYEFDINYSDPPYALGSEVIIRPDGKVDYKKANDFMNKWEMPTGDYWEQWFKEAYRTLKYGGYCVMFGMDRQLLLFKYYANLAGFEEQQSLYWYFISNFPKATDLSKQIDKNAGAEREVIGTRMAHDIRNNALMEASDETLKKEVSLMAYEYTAPATELAKKYEGYKYSISPLKQTNETILIFSKPYKTGSCLHDTLAFEKGDNECRCGALNIDGNRVPTNEDLARINKDDNGMFGVGNNNNNNKAQQMKEQGLEYGGRYPAQTFCDSNTAEVLDKQSGNIKSNNKNMVEQIDSNESTFGSSSKRNVTRYSDTNGCSKILHKCDYEKGECDLYFYNPKVSKSERNAGCDEFPLTNENRSNAPLTHAENRQASVHNSHPTLKPIKLNKNILALFKTPSEQRIVYPFAGSGSEIIGGIKAGFNNWCGCEISQDYIDIALARIEYWSNFEGCEVPETTEVAEGQMDIWEMI